jgi:hypothetical protein
MMGPYGDAAARWCKRCGQPVELTGGALLEGEFRKAVHAATGQETGEYGHRVIPVPAEPPHWRACRILAAEFEGIFTVDAWFGFLRADWANIPDGTAAAHFEADDEESMRRRLNAALARLRRPGTGDGPPPADAAGAP